jgi:hypothetical protein
LKRVANLSLLTATFLCRLHNDEAGFDDDLSEDELTTTECVKLTYRPWKECSPAPGQFTHAVARLALQSASVDRVHTRDHAVLRSPSCQSRIVATHDFDSRQWTYKQYAPAVLQSCSQYVIRS